MRTSDLSQIMTKGGSKLNVAEHKLIHSIHKQTSTTNRLKYLTSQLKSIEHCLKVLGNQDAISQKILLKRYMEHQSVKLISEDLGLSVGNTRDKLQKVEKMFLRLYKHYQGGAEV